MKDLEKMMIFMFLGLIFAIAVLGYHKSGGTPSLASRSAPTYTGKTSTQTSVNPYHQGI